MKTLLFTTCFLTIGFLSAAIPPVRSEVTGNIVTGTDATFSVEMNSIRIKGNWRAAVITSPEDASPMRKGPRLGGIVAVNCQTHEYYTYDDKTNTKSSIRPIPRGSVVAGFEQIMCAY